MTSLFGEVYYIALENKPPETILPFYHFVGLRAWPSELVDMNWKIKTWKALTLGPFYLMMINRFQEIWRFFDDQVLNLLAIFIVRLLKTGDGPSALPLWLIQTQSHPQILRHSSNTLSMSKGIGVDNLSLYRTSNVTALRRRPHCHCWSVVASFNISVEYWVVEASPELSIEVDSCSARLSSCLELFTKWWLWKALKV